MCFDARTQILSLGGDHPCRSRTRASNLKRAVFTCRLNVMERLSSLKELWDRALSEVGTPATAGQRLFYRQCTRSPAGRYSQSFELNARTSSLGESPLSAEDLVWPQSIFVGHAKGRAILALLLPVWRQAQDACSGHLPGRTDGSREVATPGSSDAARGGRGSVAQEKRIAACWLTWISESGSGNVISPWDDRSATSHRMRDFSFRAPSRNFRMKMRSQVGKVSQPRKNHCALR